MKQLKLAIWSCFALFLFCASSALAASRKIPVLLLDGESGGPFHNWQVTTPILKMELEETGLFEVTVATAPVSTGDFSNFNPDFSIYEVIVSNLDSPKWPENLRSKFERYVRNGGGLVIVHAADNAFPTGPLSTRWLASAVGRGRTENAGPYWYIRMVRSSPTRPLAPPAAHGARLPFLITSRDPDHPIMKGLPTAWMHQNDELYGMMRGPGQNMTILATAHSDPRNRGTGYDEPMGHGAELWQREDLPHHAWP